MALHETTQIRRLSKAANLLIGLVVFSMNGLAATDALAQSAGACDSLYSEGQYGPFDYRTDEDKIAIVLMRFHFTPEVEALIHSTASANAAAGDDIDYTLRAIPNYPRALIAMMRLGEKGKTPQPRGSRYSVECWFDRAVRFRPDDVVVRMIYSTYLNKQGRITDATKELEIATTYAEDDAFIHYSFGPHYIGLKNYDKAPASSFPQTALRDKLQAIGKWTEPAGATGTIALGAEPPGKME